MTAVSSFLLILLLGSLSETVFTSTLKMVVVYHRHGARNTLHNYGTNQLELGQLNEVGIKQMNQLGQQFRKKYIDDAKLIPVDYDEKLVYIRSTAVNRTQMSAKAFLSGLYPNQYPLNLSYSEQYNPSSSNIRGVSISEGNHPNPIQTVPLEKDYLLHAYEKTVCPQMTSLQNGALIQEDYTNMLHAFNDTYMKVVEVMNLSNHQPDLKYMSGVSDYLYSNYMVNKTTEIEVGSDLWKDLMLSKNISVLYSKYSTRQEMNVFTTKMYEELLDRMDSLINNKSTVRFVEYSAHDYTVNLILASMNITSWQCLFNKYQAKDYSFDPKCPFTTEVGGSLTFELYEQDDGSYTIRLIFGSEGYPIAGKVEIPYDEFSSLLRNSMVPNFLEQCVGKKQQQFIADDSYDPTNKTLSFVILAITLLVLGFAFYLRRKYHQNLAMEHISLTTTPSSI